MDTPPPAPPAPPTPPAPPAPSPGVDENQKVKLTLETGEYFGPVKDGVPHGVGEYRFVNGSVWRGEYVNGKRYMGKTTRPDGREFEGEWRDDTPYNGVGTASYSNGDTFTGEWKKGHPYTGKGFVHYNIGDYEGEIYEGKMHGKGKIILKDGRISDGEWKNGKMHGKGEYTEKDKLHYIGDFLDGKMHGEGILVFADGNEYNGGFKNDKREGKGKQFYKSEGATYEGDWYNDKKQGQGKIIYKDGSTYEGNWTYDTKDGQGKFMDKDGSNYEGGWYGDKKHGEGKLTDSKGKITIGIWRFNNLSDIYPVLKVSRDVFVEGCVTLVELEKWENNDIIMLYNPPKYTFDVTKTIDSSAKSTTNICNYMFTRKDLRGLKRVEVENEEESEDDESNNDVVEFIENPYNRVLMDEKHLKPYVLSIIGPNPASAVSEGSSAGGKGKRKQTIKRRYKNKKKKQQTKRNIH